MMTLVTTGGGKPRTKYMKVHEEYIKERLKTWEVVLEYISIKNMLVDLLTKPLGGELYHSLRQKLLGGHCYECLNNRGAKGKSVSNIRNLASVESLVPALADLTCSNQTSGQPTKNHGTKRVPNANTKLKQQKG